MKGIVLAGGSGTRLYPITKGVSKQLLPVYDKPMIYYPISLLMLAGIREILIITTKFDSDNFKNLLEEGKQFGLKIEYAIQEKPNGLAEAFIIGQKFIGDDSVCLVLGDNILHGHGLIEEFKKCKEYCNKDNSASIFGFNVNNPKDFGVANSDKNGKVISIEEKPKNPKSNTAIIGVYFYPNDVVNIAKKVKPSDRGELEISSINQYYLKEKKLRLVKLGRGYSWFDTGTIESLYNASNFISTIQKNSNLHIGNLEEIAIKNKWASKTDIKNSIDSMSKSSYSKYVRKMLDGI